MSSTHSENSSAPLPLRPALKEEREEPTSPRSGPVKSVSIAEPQDEPQDEPLLSPIEESSKIKQFKAKMADKRLTGRPSSHSNSSSRLNSMISLVEGNIEEPITQNDASMGKSGDSKHHRPHIHHHRHQHQHEKLLSQVTEWLHGEKAKRAAKKSRRKGHGTTQDGSTTSRTRSSSQSSDSSGISLEKLQKILEGNISTFSVDSLPPGSPKLGPRRPSMVGSRRRSSIRKLGAMSSDTEYQDGDVMVPSCDVVLDNSKTMSFTGGIESSMETITLSTSKRAEQERKAWLSFKSEILKLAHTLRLKGWRKVPLERGGEIEVERLSGALTNAVYVVSPPKNIPPPKSASTTSLPHSSKPPAKLLLRVYGPQVEHLIDRENELSILRRLARKKIGPRLLGTFSNGRFEEFFNAKTLTAEDLRIESTSKQIAKRMRELHDGIDLLDKEREDGPFVWQNWDKWVDRCEEVMAYLDKEILTGSKGKGEAWRKRGLVCGVEWPKFRAAIGLHRKYLERYYGQAGVSSRLVFAHNDTQYGNILRLVPEPPTADASPSPLLLPQNTHKQLVVIDFEYASANTPGQEFANHFTEWCYNYHNTAKPWHCDTSKYPTLKQQATFIRSYVNHRPQFNPRASATPSATPNITPMESQARGSIGEFFLDARTPGGSQVDLGEPATDYNEEERQREQQTEKQVQALLNETKIWRIANSAQWVAWGIVQAKVPELDAKTKMTDGEVTAEPEEMVDGINGHPKEAEDKRPDGMKAEALRAGETVKEAEELEAEEDEFDYLAYSRDRALFFWADMVALGLTKKEDLPKEVIESLKVVEY